MPSAIAPSRRVRLQWGRAIVRAQARRRAGAAELPGDASMGARDCTRASHGSRGTGRHRCCRVNGGARLYARKLRVDEKRLDQLTASMGARDCTRASYAASTMPGTAIVLQWGRAIVRAQASARRPSSGRTRRSFNGGARLYARKRRERLRFSSSALVLQWGRAIVRAQATPEVRAQLVPWHASMGARDCTRASVSTGQYRRVSIKLQWGRAIVRAQASTAYKSGLIRSVSFNGGARLYARKPRVAAARARRRGASMGARDCTRASGAGAHRVRPRHDVLQWGRAIVRAQAKIWSVVLRSVNQLQWGRAIVRAQARDEVGVLHLALVASMGARDCTRASG